MKRTVLTVCLTLGIVTALQAQRPKAAPPKEIKAERTSLWLTRKEKRLPVLGQARAEHSCKFFGQSKSEAQPSWSRKIRITP